MSVELDPTADRPAPSAQQRLGLGMVAPTFELPDPSGTMWSPAGAAATVVVFTSNHCPFALAWHERILAAMTDNIERGVESFFISSNDAERSSADGLDGMRARVTAGDFGDIPYLRDESQDVAKSFGATNTPDVFVFDAELVLRWRGAPDDDCEEPSRNAASLREAIDAVLAGAPIATDTTFAVGCPIKWRGLVDPFGPPPRPTV